jgi:NAD(P)-dependent dehydrogenase (short-subunit alcohol dehydrogenase family)
LTAFGFKTHHGSNFERSGFMADPKRACLIVGAGDGMGSALARAFAAEGLVVCLTRRARNLDTLEAQVAALRASGAEAHAYGVDARAEDDMIALVDRIEAEVGPLEVVIFNIGANVRFGIRETTTRVFQKVWEMACFAGFLAGREAARVMVPRGRGTILFTGATASTRGRDGFAAFAAAKAGLRAVAQSMARELGPLGIHVAHIVVDGPIDGAFIRGLRPNADELAANYELLQPDDIAASFVAVHRQARTAWTHELDVRPWREPW